MRPVLGTFSTPTGPNDLVLDVDRLLSSRLLLQAQSGAGKSWALRRVLEQTHGLCQQLVLDPEGEFTTLRAKFDYVLAAPQGGDVLASPRTAKLLAEKLLELRVSAVMDLYELSVHERVQFVRYFLEALINAPKDLWHPVLVVVDEAHSYAPEKGEAESLNAVIDLCSKGRKRGFAALLATQRLAKLHKDAAAECGNKLIGRCTLDVDMKRAAEELGFTSKEEKLGLRSLATGEFYTYGPALGQSMEVRRVRIGPVLTPHPKAGQRTAAQAPAPSEKVKAVLSKLADLPAEAAARERTLADLQKENRELRAAVKKLEVVSPVVKPVVSDSTREQLAKLQDELITTKAALKVKLEAYGPQLEQLVGNKVMVLADKMREDLWTVVQALRAPLPMVSLSPALAREANPTPLPPPRRRGMTPLRGRPLDDDGAIEFHIDTTRSTPENGDEGPLTGPEQRILSACAWLERDQTETPAQAVVAFVAGYTYGAGGFNNPKGRLNQRGLIQYLSGERMQLTQAGRALAEPPGDLLTDDEIHQRVLQRLKGPERRVLQPLLAHYPKPMNMDLLAQKANYAPGTGGFNNPRGHLRALTLIDYPDPGFARAADFLFLTPLRSDRV